MISKHSVHLLVKIGALAVMGTACAPSVMAQQTPVTPDMDQSTSQASPKPEDAEQLPTVIVTADKRSQSEKDVPSTVSVLTGSTLDNLGVSNFQDFATYVPGLSSASGGAGENQLVLRGVTTGNTGTSSTVGVYVDETPIGSSSSFAQGSNALDFSTFDLDRIEVLSGPQGTLYGASTMGGLLKYVTNAPDLGSYDGAIQTGLSNMDNGGLSHNERGMFNLPLIKDKLALRVDAFDDYTTGYIDNPTLDRNDVNASRARGGRIALLYQITPDLNLQLSAVAQNIHRQGSSVIDINPLTLQPTSGSYDHASDFPEPFSQHLLLYTALLNWNLGWGKLTSVSSWQDLGLSYDEDESIVYDAVFDPLLAEFGLVPAGTDVPWNIVTHGNTRKFTQEVRLASLPDTFFEWQVGGYFDLEHSNATVALFDENNADGQLAEGIPAYNVSLPTMYREVAGFADGTFHFTPKLDLTVGVRYSGDSQDYTQNLQGILGDPTNPNPFAIQTNSASSHETVLTYLFNPSYQLTDNTNIYARAASGYRPGGPNFVAFNALGQPEGSPTFGTDKLWTYELGQKTTFLDNRASLDFDVYYTNWSAIQTEANVDGINQILNGGKAHIRGAEFTGKFNVARGLTIGGNMSYANAELATDAPTLDALAGQRLPLTPRFSAAATADYAFPLWNGIGGNAGISYRYVGSRPTGFDGSAVRPQYWLPSYELVDLRFGVQVDNLNVSLFVKNAFNRLGQISADTSTVEYVPSGPVRVAITEPRTIGLEATYQFGQ